MTHSRDYTIWLDTGPQQIESELTVNYSFTAGRPAPSCSNPSSPAFSDPGDAPELTIEDILLNGEPCTEIPDAWETAIEEHLLANPPE